MHTHDHSEFTNLIPWCQG